MNVHKKTFQYGPHSVTIETGRLARQADGSVLVSMGDTSVLVTAVGRKEAAPGKDFFPLTVNYIEKTYAAGRIPGGFFKREGRPTEKETLISRLIDRPIRPLFPEVLLQRVQVVATVVSLDPEIDSDIPALLGASAALSLSGLPFKGPIARRARWLSRRPVPAEPGHQGPADVAARPRRRRHGRRGADGRVRSPGAPRGRHARRRRIRP